MTHHNLDLPFWEGFIASNLERHGGAVWITLRRDPAAAMVWWLRHALPLSSRGRNADRP
jgi:hypothetical protein